MATINNGPKLIIEELSLLMEALKNSNLIGLTPEEIREIGAVIREGVLAIARISKNPNLQADFDFGIANVPTPDATDRQKLEYQSGAFGSTQLQVDEPEEGHGRLSF